MFKKILLAVDLNHDSSWVKALPAAVSIATSDGASITAAMVMPDIRSPLVDDFFPEDFEAKLHAKIDLQLAEFVAQRIPDSIEADHLTVSGGRIYNRVLEVADQIGADLIVMAAYRPDLKDILLGPVADRVVRHARQSVLVVRE